MSRWYRSSLTWGTIYRDLTGRGIPTRTAATLVGSPRATATRAPRIQAAPPVTVSTNRLEVLARARILAVLNSARFVDSQPIQIYVQLLDEDVYLALISTIYRSWPRTRRARNRVAWRTTGRAI